MTHKAPRGIRINEEVLEGRGLFCCCCSFGFCYFGVFVLFFSVFVCLLILVWFCSFQFSFGRLLQEEGYGKIGVEQNWGACCEITKDTINKLGRKIKKKRKGSTTSVFESKLLFAMLS